jgi:hypothetical protein
MNSRHRIAVSIIASLACLSSTAHADPAELQRVNNLYERSVEKAIAPLKLTYQQELQRLLETYLKNGRLEDAVAVKTVLEKSKGSADQKTELPPAEKLKTLFVNKTWVTSTGITKYTFLEDGKGSFQTKTSVDPDPFTWEIHADSTVQVTTKDRVLQFTFKSGTEGAHTSKDDPNEFRLLHVETK